MGLGSRLPTSGVIPKNKVVKYCLTDCCLLLIGLLRRGIIYKQLHSFIDILKSHEIILHFRNSLFIFVLENNCIKKQLNGNQANTFLLQILVCNVNKVLVF